MTYVLEKTLNIGRFRLTVIAQKTVRGHVIARRGLACICSKTPVFLILDDGTHSTILDMAGTPVARDTVTALCPAVATL